MRRHGGGSSEVVEVASWRVDECGLLKRMARVII